MLTTGLMKTNTYLTRLLNFWKSKFVDSEIGFNASALDGGPLFTSNSTRTLLVLRPSKASITPGHLL